MAPERLGGDWRPRGPQRTLARGGCDALGDRGSRMRQPLIGRSREHPEYLGHGCCSTKPGVARGSSASDPAVRRGALRARTSLPWPVQRGETGTSRGERRMVFRCGGELDGQLDAVLGGSTDYLGSTAAPLSLTVTATTTARSEERRVGKESTPRWSAY